MDTNEIRANLGTVCTSLAFLGSHERSSLHVSMGRFHLLAIWQINNQRIGCWSDICHWCAWQGKVSCGSYVHHCLIDCYFQVSNVEYYLGLWSLNQVMLCDILLPSFLPRWHFYYSRLDLWCLSVVVQLTIFGADSLVLVGSISCQTLEVWFLEVLVKSVGMYWRPTGGVSACFCAVACCNCNIVVVVETCVEVCVICGGVRRVFVGSFLRK